VAGDRAGGVGCEVDDGGCDLLDGGDLAGRKAAADLGRELGVGEHGLGHRGADEGRRDGVDADAVRRPLDGQCLREAVDRVLGRAVRGAAGVADRAHLRRDRHDPAGGAAPEQVAPHRAAGEEGAAQVDVGEQIEVGRRVVRGRPRAVEPGGGDEDVDGLRRGDRTLDLVLVADVGDRDARRSSGVLDLRGHRLELVARPGHERHRSARVGERERRAPVPGRGRRR
jgi:hypothetical protein